MKYLLILMFILFIGENTLRAQCIEYKLTRKTQVEVDSFFNSDILKRAIRFEFVNCTTRISQIYRDDFKSKWFRFKKPTPKYLESGKINKYSVYYYTKEYNLICIVYVYN